MEIKEAVEIIKKNWPDSKYSMLREALQVVLDNLSTSDNKDCAKCPECNEKMIPEKIFCPSCGYDE